MNPDIPFLSFSYESTPNSLQLGDGRFMKDWWPPLDLQTNFLHPTDDASSVSNLMTSRHLDHGNCGAIGITLNYE